MKYFLNISEESVYFRCFIIFDTQRYVTNFLCVYLYVIALTVYTKSNLTML